MMFAPLARRIGAAAALGIGVGFAPGAPALAQDAYTTAGINLRSGPGPRYPTITFLEEGSAVDIIGPCRAWCQVVADGAQGWVVSAYLDRSGAGYRPPPPPVYGAPPVYAPPLYGAPPVYGGPRYGGPPPVYGQDFDRPRYRPRPPDFGGPPPGPRPGPGFDRPRPPAAQPQLPQPPIAQPRPQAPPLGGARPFGNGIPRGGSGPCANVPVGIACQ